MFFRPPNSAPSFRQCLKPSTPEVTPEQRRQSGSKSRGRESSRKKVSKYRRKNFRFSGKISDFPGKHSDDFFSPQLKKLSFLPKYSHFHFLHLHSYLFFLSFL